ncbi:hypothetical protein ACQI4L_27905 [Mycolicibacterium litorale]|uniref:hypothetical protein n=1 Tax=Mycolicibacterium litorale TaxID=758802 RepID=UPI003CEAA13B
MIAATAALAGLALPKFIPHGRLQMGTVGEWVAASVTFAAVITAFAIATVDRREREKERRAEEATVARLVRLRVTCTGSASVDVYIRNYGELPILDVDIANVSWTKHPEARWGTILTNDGTIARGNTKRPMLLNYRQSDNEVSSYQEASPPTINYPVWFMHPTVDEALIDTSNFAPIDLSTVIIKIQFTTANGVRWETSTIGSGMGQPVRL